MLDNLLLLDLLLDIVVKNICWPKDLKIIRVICDGETNTIKLETSEMVIAKI
jgi:hypothetical protein